MRDSTKHIIQKCILIPQRYLTALISFLAVVSIYQMRICLHVAITEMVQTRHTDNITAHNDSVTCPVMEDSPVLEYSPHQGAILFDWSEERQGLILSSFYWGYVLTHLPAGILADKFGGKHTFGLGLISSTLLTLLMPFAAEYGDLWLIIARFLIGLGQGLVFPAVTCLLAKWAPPNERGFLVSFVFSGSQMGTITGSLISGAILHTYEGNWPLVFYFFSGIGFILSLVWFIFIYSSPDVHPFIAENEKNYLNEKLPQDKNLPSPPWKSIATSIPVWALLCAQLGHNWAFYTIVTDLPKYMKDVMKFSIGANGILSSLPFMVMWIMSLASGWICDQLIKKKVMTVTVARRVFTSIAHVGTAAGLIGATYAGCDRILVVTCFCLVMGTMAFYYAGMKVNSLDLSPNYSGTLMAITNGIASFSGIFTPYLVGILTPNHTLYEWRIVFYITAIINIVTIIFYDIFSSGEVQPWNDAS